MLNFFGGIKTALSQSSRVNNYLGIPPGDNSEDEIEQSSYFDCTRGYRNIEDLENQNMAQGNGCLTPFYKCFEFFSNFKTGSQVEMAFSPSDRGLMRDINSFLNNQINTDNTENGIQYCKVYLEALDTLNEHRIQSILPFEREIKNTVNTVNTGFSRDDPSPTVWRYQKSNEVGEESLQNLMNSSLQELVNLGWLKAGCLPLELKDKNALVALLLNKLTANS